MRRTLILLTIICPFSQISPGLLAPGGPNTGRAEMAVPCFATVSNHLRNGRRDTAVTIDGSDYNEASFQSLLQYLSARYPDEERLEVEVRTEGIRIRKFWLTQDDIDCVREVLDGGLDEKCWRGSAQQITFLSRDRDVEKISYNPGDYKPLRVVKVMPRLQRQAPPPLGRTPAVVRPNRQRPGKGTVCHFEIQNQEDERGRFIRVFVDSDAPHGPSEVALRSLANRLSATYPLPDYLVVDLFNDDLQERSYERGLWPRDGSPLEVATGVGDEAVQRWVAALYGRDGNMVVRYRLPGQEDVETLIPSGSDVFPGLDGLGAARDAASPAVR
ncbi:MAG TPA: hypothetical protein VJX67_25090 [Blastocatellia bacterium]|nr:hypothetical protein [Blastocatellia bacterium]